MARYLSNVFTNYFISCCLIGHLVFAEIEEKRVVEIPSGDASNSLLILAESWDVDILYSHNHVVGVQTQSVKGYFTLYEALAFMLINTGLEYLRDEKTNSLVVRRKKPALLTTSKVEFQETEEAATHNMDQESKDTFFSNLGRGLVLLLLSGRTSSETSEKGIDEDIFELSPFTVNTSGDVGYLAMSTLAGTRLNTNLRDVGASVSVVTQELLEDLQSNELLDFLQYTAGAEVGGLDGNFAGSHFSNGRPDNDANRENPQRNQRVRGICSATLTRNYFRTDYSADSYNIERITINRGPNALLFGIGNPAGVIESSTKQAHTRNDSNVLRFRFGSENTRRVTVDVNKIILQNRLAVRVAGLNEESYLKQKPAFEYDKRFYATFEALLLKNENSTILDKLTLRGSIERVSIEANPVNVIPPIDSYSLFFEPLNASILDLPGINIRAARYDPNVILPNGSNGTWEYKVSVNNLQKSNTIPSNMNGLTVTPYFIQIPLVYESSQQLIPGYTGQDVNGIMGRIRYRTKRNGRGQVDYAATANAYTGLAGFSSVTLQNTDVLDYESNLISGDSNRVFRDFRAQNLVLEQLFFAGNVGFEAAYDRQIYDTDRFFLFNSGQNGAENGQSAIKIDTAEFLNNDDPNPNHGRPFIVQSMPDNQIKKSERESMRLTGFASLDLDAWGEEYLGGIPLGKHTITGLWARDTHDITMYEFGFGWNSEDPTFRSRSQMYKLGGFRNRPIIFSYLGPSAYTASVVGKDDLRITDVFSNPIPQAGERYTVTFFDWTNRKLTTEEAFIERFLDNGGASRQRITSHLVSWQGKFLNDHLVGLISARHDNLKTYSDKGNQTDDDGRFLLNEVNFKLIQADRNANESLNEAGENVDSITWSVVARFPESVLFELPAKLDLSAYYNESENFNPEGLARNIYGVLLPPTSGETIEYGFLVELFQRRVSVRLNWFETKQFNIRNNAGGATGAVYNFADEFLLNRYFEAQRSGIAFSSIMGVDASGISTYEELYNIAMNKLLPAEIVAKKSYKLTGIKVLDSDGFQQFDADGRPIIDYSLQTNPPPGSLTDTSMLEASGFEAEVVGNITDSWRVYLNASQQETIMSDAGLATTEVAQEFFTNLEQFSLLGMSQGPALTETMNIAGRWAQQVSTPLNATVARNGAVSLEQREWRINMVTSYTLNDEVPNLLRGLTVGGAVRWQSKIANGNPFLMGDRLKEHLVDLYPDISSASEIPDDSPLLQLQIPDLENPFLGDPVMNGDLFVRYRRKLNILGRNVNWSIQFNIRNILKDKNPAIVSTNPDGQVAVIRIPNVTTWSINNTIRF